MGRVLWRNTHPLNFRSDFRRGCWLPPPLLLEHPGPGPSRVTHWPGEFVQLRRMPRPLELDEPARALPTFQSRADCDEPPGWYIKTDIFCQSLGFDRVATATWGSRTNGSIDLRQAPETSTFLIPVCLQYRWPTISGISFGTRFHLLSASGTIDTPIESA